MLAIQISKTISVGGVCRPVSGSSKLSYSSFRLEVFEPDQLKEVLAHLEVEHTLLPGGHNSFAHQRLTVGTTTLDSGVYGRAIEAKAGVPEVRSTVGFLLAGQQPAYTTGHQIRRHSVQLYAPGEELHYRAAPHTSWVVCSVDPEVLQDSALNSTGKPLAFPKTGCISVEPTAEAGQHLADTIRRSLAAGAGAGAEKADKVCPAAAAIEEELHQVIAFAVQSANQDSSKPRATRAAPRRSRIVRRAEGYLRENLSEPFRLAELSQATGVSARMLEYYWRDVFGLTPLEWVRSKKLNRAYEDLLHGDRRVTRVTDVALEWGFSHLGRFSREYRRLFGEKPSETLRRRPQC